LENSVATLALRLKSFHFEVAGLSPDDVANHTAKIKPTVFEGAPDRPELPGARYYEEPAPNSGCAVESAKVDFNTAVTLTLAALKLREGPHKQIIKESANTDSTNFADKTRQYRAQVNEIKKQATQTSSVQMEQEDKTTSKVGPGNSRQ